MELTIKESNENFETWLSKDFVSDELKQMVSKASILLVPFENLRDAQNPLMFPKSTEEILNYFKANLSDNFTIEICITDEDYQEFAFYSHSKRLGNFLIIAAVVPVFVNIFSSYVYDNYIKVDNSKPQIQIIDNSTYNVTNNHISKLADKKYLEPTHIEFSITIVDTNGTSKNISYEGPASEIDNVLKSLKEYEK